MRNIKVVKITRKCISIDYRRTLRHPQNRKYTAYCIAVRGGPSHRHR